MKKMLAGYICFFAVLFLIFFGGRADLWRTSNRNKYHDEATNLSYVSKIEGKDFYLYNTKEGWQDLFLVGVNLGVAKPGYFPGDFAITKEEYLRWFAYIRDMNANTLRVYVAQTPAFYQALKEFNASAETPLYLLHGVYLNENDILEYEDAYAANGKIEKGFINDIYNVIDIIHGNVEIPQTTGNAGGIYNADISQYVIGWILGIEWEAGFVTGTNENNPQKTAYDGEYIYIEDATPFEVFLTEAADAAVAYETTNYQEQRPLAMSNWVTSDPLEHPGEPNPTREDAVSVDTEKLKAKEAFVPGLFASYHVYPYYPDMFNYDEKYLQDDPPNSYAAYLEELNAHHSSMPVLISEVGLPASRGITHENIYSGFNQGHLSETQQGEMLTSLVSDIYDEQMMGAIVFLWQDEWFKRTWNTEMLDIAERRPYWMDYQTNEQNFGVLAFDPGDKESVCYVDGEISEWGDSDVVVQNEGYTISAKSDEKFLYLMVDGTFGEDAIYVPFNTIAEQGNTKWNDTNFTMGVDFMLVLDGEENSSILVDAYYEPTYFLYGSEAGYNLDIMERRQSWEQKDSGLFVPITMMLDRGWTLPETGQVIPYTLANTSILRYGIANPEVEGYDSLADFYSKDGATEIRVPWLLLNVSDPSSGKIIGDLYKNEGIVAQDAKPFQIGVYTEATQERVAFGEYAWARWEMPTYHERLKESYYILQTYFAEIEEAALPQKTTIEKFLGQWNRTQFSDVATWFPIQPVLNYMLAFLFSVIFYFFLVLLYIHMSSIYKSHKAGVLQQKILATAQEEIPLHYIDRLGRYEIEGVSKPFSRDSLLIFNTTLQEADEIQKEQVQALMLKIGYADFVLQQMKTKDIGYLILLIRMIGLLGLTSMADRVTELLYTHKDNTDLQYQGMQTISLLGSYENLVKIAMDEQFVQTLSFRSLQEIFKVYKGDKAKLYETLLSSPDTFIVRIAIKRIGAEGFFVLAPKVYPFLTVQNDNVVIDAIRTMGQLQYQEAAPIIVGLLNHTRWEVRAIAVKAIAQIDIDQYEKEIVVALGDEEWQVRNNAATVLSSQPNIIQILQDVAQSGDKYAFEALNYMVVTKEIWKEK